MGFVNDMALRFLALFGLAALMSTTLMARDLLGGIGWRFYHIGAAVLWIVGLGLAAGAVWEAHRVLMRARIKLREKFSGELDPAKVSPGHLASWAQEASSALDVINAFPVWPTTLASLGAGMGSLLALAASLLIPVWLQSP